MKKGNKGVFVALIALIAGVVVVIGIVASLFYSLGWTKSLSMEVSYNEKEIIEHNILFDAEKNYLRNSLWVVGSFGTYLNGQNGTIYSSSWNQYNDLPVWKDTGGLNIPPKSDVEDMLLERFEDTYQDYFNHLEHTEIDYLSKPLSIEMNEYEINLSYQIHELNLTKEFLNHSIQENNVWINVTVPARYMMVYDNITDFLQDTTDMKDNFIDVLDDVEVCTGQGRLSSTIADRLMRTVTNDIAAELEANYPETEWEVELLDVNSLAETDPPPDPDYHLVFTVAINVSDCDDDRRVMTDENYEKVAISFVVEDEIDFERTVSYICDCGSCTSDSSCSSSGSSSDCSGGTCEYWEVDGTGKGDAIGDCSSGTDCFCEKSESCDCTNSPPDKCFNEDESKPSPLSSSFSGCFECGSKGEKCCNTPTCSNSGCRGSLKCRSGCTCRSTTTSTSTSTTTSTATTNCACLPASICNLIGGSCSGWCPSGCRCC